MATSVFLIVLLCYLAVLAKGARRPVPDGLFETVRAGLAEMQRLDADRQQRFARQLDERTCGAWSR